MSSMAPTLVFQNYSNQTVPYLSIGSPGGSRIIGGILNVLTYILDVQYCLGDAVAKGRFISRNLGYTEVETLYHDNDTIAALNNRGFNVVPLRSARPAQYVQVCRIVPTSNPNAPNITFTYEAMADSMRLATAQAAGY